MTTKSQTNSPTPLSLADRHYDSTCSGCGKRYLAKAGDSCPKCQGLSTQTDEITKKTFSASDTDLIKGF